MLQEIKNLADVKLFAETLIKNGTSFHPDDDFSTFIDLNTGNPSFTKEDARKLNQLMSECFTVCEKNDVDIYDFMCELFLTETGLNKFIPLPSEAYKA